MAEAFLQYQNSSLHYEVLGSGAKTLFLFHGFGQDLSVFKTMVNALSSVYTIYAVDLYFHGKSVWGYGEAPLEKQHWKETFTALLANHQITTFYLAGFSLGSKFALAVLENFPQHVAGLYLIAPDGVRTSFWYSLATYPVPLRKAFKSMIHHPNLFKAISGTLQTLKLMDKGLIRFADTQMDTEEKRRRVYYSWVVFRRLRFNMKALAGQLNAHAIPVTLITGRFDKVIKTENMNVLLKHLNTYRLEIVESGHNGLIAASAPHMM